MPLTMECCKTPLIIAPALTIVGFYNSASSKSAGDLSGLARRTTAPNQGTRPHRRSMHKPRHRTHIDTRRPRSVEFVLRLLGQALRNAQWQASLHAGGHRAAGPFRMRPVASCVDRIGEMTFCDEIEAISKVARLPPALPEMVQLRCRKDLVKMKTQPSQRATRPVNPLHPF